MDQSDGQKTKKQKQKMSVAGIKMFRLMFGVIRQDKIKKIHTRKGESEEVAWK